MDSSVDTFYRYSALISSFTAEAPAGGRIRRVQSTKTTDMRPTFKLATIVYFVLETIVENHKRLYEQFYLLTRSLSIFAVVRWVENNKKWSQFWDETAPQRLRTDLARRPGQIYQPR